MSPLRVLGQGMEGLVYEVDATSVAKLWWDADPAALRRGQAFHAALAGLPLPFAVPRVLDVVADPGGVSTLEARLPGRGLADEVCAGSLSREDALGVVVDVVAALADAGPLTGARSLSVLDETSPLVGSGDFPDALAGLAERRAGRFPVLGRSVDRFAALLAALPDRLREVDTGRRAVVHGDLVPANVLVDAGRATAVLDWGFLTTEGDPAFDGAVTAAVFDMYGERALATELELLERFEDRLGVDRATLLVHRAAYSVVTANAYDPEGRDGHFAWCVAGLQRPDVTKALLGG